MGRESTNNFRSTSMRCYSKARLPAKKKHMRALIASSGPPDRQGNREAVRLVYPSPG
jgi:hypothetical protein